MIMRDWVPPLPFDSQHCLNFLPLPHGQASFLPTFAIDPPVAQ
jgi:hypothetical protein